jgi:hypothetical protein
MSSTGEHPTHICSPLALNKTEVAPVCVTTYAADSTKGRLNDHARRARAD